MKTIRQRTLRALYPLKVAWWFWTRPNTKGVKCLLFHENRVLLVKLAYAHRQWSIPGGGVDAGESYAEAAIREVREEVGIELSAVTLIGTYTQSIQYKNDTVHCFMAEVDSADFSIDEFEVSAARWFSLAEIESMDVAASVPRIIQLVREDSGFLTSDDNMVRSQI